MTDTLTDIATGPVPPGQPPRPRRRWMRYLAVVLAVAMLYPAVTYLRALTYPGNASVAVRTVDWLRDDMGMGPVVNSIENWWFTRHKPSDGPPAANAVPHFSAPVVAPPGPRPADLPTHGGFLLRGEGVWRPVDRQGGLYTTYFRPDPAHGSVLAGAAWFNQDLVTARQIAGTKEPVADPGAPGRVPDSLRAPAAGDVQLRVQDGRRERRQLPRRANTRAAA